MVEQLAVAQTKGAFSLVLTRGQVLVAEMTAMPHGSDLMVHHQFHETLSPRLLRIMKRIFAAFRNDVRHLGYRLIITCSDRYTETMGTYWRMMGFHWFGEVTVGTVHRITYAFMEA